LAERLSVAATARVFGHPHATITTSLTRATQHSATLHNRVLRHLEVPHIQFDQLRTRLRNRAHTLWLWVNGIAQRFVRTLKQWLADKTWQSASELEALLQQFRAEYNERPHQGLGIPGLSPNEFADRIWLM
jgi:hypothetical protein